VRESPDRAMPKTTGIREKERRKGDSGVAYVSRSEESGTLKATQKLRGRSGQPTFKPSRHPPQTRAQLVTPGTFQAPRKKLRNTPPQAESAPSHRHAQSIPGRWPLAFSLGNNEVHGRKIGAVTSVVASQQRQAFRGGMGPNVKIR
jgi:hypothetical protein